MRRLLYWLVMRFLMSVKLHFEPCKASLASDGSPSDSQAQT